MSKEKQIEELARKLRAYCYDIELKDNDDCRRLADFIIDTLGYRKQSVGEWIWIRDRTYGEPSCYCSECFEGWSEYGFDKFCPNCGVRMKGGE